MSKVLTTTQSLLSNALSYTERKITSLFHYLIPKNLPTHDDYTVNLSMLVDKSIGWRVRNTKVIGKIREETINPAQIISVMKKR